MNNLILSEKAKTRPYFTDKTKFNLNSNELDKIMGKSETNNLIDILVSTYIKKGNLLFDKSLFNPAFKCYSKALEIYNTFPTKDEFIIYIYNKLAECKINTLCYEEALAYLCEGYCYSAEFADKNNYTDCIFNMALIYKRLNDFDNALFYINKFLDLLDSNNDSIKYLEAVILKCECYIGKNLPSYTIALCDEVFLNLGDKLEKYRGYIYNTLGKAYLQNNNRKISLKYFNKALDFKSSNDKATISHSLIDMSNLYINEGLYKKAIELLNNGLILSEEYNDNEYLLKGYLLLEKIYIKLNDYEELEYLYIQMLEELKGIDFCVLMDIYMKLSTLSSNNIDYSKLSSILSKNRFFITI
jgi:tetratricopeptide (TPR) repeat protein